MGPIRGSKKRKRTEKKVDHNVLTTAALSSLQPQEKQEPPIDWWDHFSKRITGPLAESKDFETVFNISRKTFNYICSLVKDDMMARQSNVTDLNGKPLNLKDQVAVALRRLSSGESLSNVGVSLGIHQSTVSQITWRFVEAMEEKGLQHLNWPSSEAKMEEIKCKFAKLSGLPNCCGAIGTTHIVMTLPTVDQSNEVWIDSEKNHSMILQAIVGPDLRFLDVNIGYPGSLSDALVLQNSRFFKLSEEGKRLNGKRMELTQGTELGEYIVGYVGFPLLPWLLTPYQIADSGHQVEFNKRHSIAQAVVQLAFARLKEMWRIIKGVLWLPDKHRLPRIILVCCLLHNVVIDLQDKVIDCVDRPALKSQDYVGNISVSDSESGADSRDKLSLNLYGS